MPVSPLADFRALFGRIPPIDAAQRNGVAAVFERAGVGGSQLAVIAAMVAGLTGRKPAVSRPSLTLFAGTHGVARHKVSARRIDSTLATVAAAGSGDAPANQLCAVNMVGLKVYDLALHLPTGDIAAEPAMDERTLAATFAFGMEAIAGGADLVLLSAIRSAGDEAVAAALLTAVAGGDAADWGSAEAAPAVRQALSRHGSAADPLALFGQLGGREFAGIAGAILAARIERIPVVLDGMTALAAACVLRAVDPASIEHCLLAAAEDEPMRRAAAWLGVRPLVGANVSAGEGTAAVLASTIVKDALALHAGLAAHAPAHSH